MGRVLFIGILAPALAVAALSTAHAADNPLLMSPQAAALAGQGPTKSFSQVQATMAQAGRRASKVVGHNILFDVQGMDARSASVVADVADQTAQAFENSALVLNGREKTIVIKRVLFVESSRPDARLEGDVLKISIASQLGAAGRPTAEQIFHVLATQATT